MFEIGDKIFYPMNGVGVVSGIEDKEVLGNVQPYYLIQIPASNMDVMVPVERAEKIGLRPITDTMTIQDILQELQNKDVDLDTPWKDKYPFIMEKIKSGDIKDTALIYKYLTLRSKEKTLNTNEKSLLHKVHKFLINEICMSQNISENEAEELLVV